MSEEPGRSIFDLASSDPHSQLIDRSNFTVADVAQIDRIMAAMAHLRKAEKTLSEASQRLMKLNATDMRAVHYLIVCANRGEEATPSSLAKFLGITTASTTKLIDRLERGHHAVRRPHPTDRRALCVTVTAETHAAARDSIGRHQASRFKAASRLTPEQRETVIQFLTETADDLAASMASDDAQSTEIEQ